MRSAYLMVLSAIAVLMLAFVGWRNRGVVSKMFQLGGPVDRFKQQARSAYGRVANAAKVNVSNLAHTEHDPEPLG